MIFKKYLTLIRAGILESFQFRIGTVVTIVGNLIYLVIIYFLWRAIFNSVNTPTVNGMSFEDTMIYLVLATALFYFMETYLVWNMSRDIQSGKIVLNLIKPIKFRRYMFFQSAGSLVPSFFFTFLPTFLVVHFVLNGAIHIGLNLGFFMVAVGFAIMINFFVNFFVSTICLYTESIWGINIMKEVIVLLLSGASIPLAFFPASFAKVVMYLPFQAIYNTPLKLLLDYNMPIGERFSMIGVQFFWLIFMGIASDLFWMKSIKQITVNGG